jgi:hypothetical protein
VLAHGAWRHAHIAGDRRVVEDVTVREGCHFEQAGKRLHRTQQALGADLLLQIDTHVVVQKSA